MAAPSAIRVHRSPGKIYIDPTDLSDSANAYGGTELGFAGRIGMTIGLLRYVVQAEETRRPIDVLEHQGYDIRVSIPFRQWDDDVLQSIWPTTQVGSASGSQVVIWPDSTPARLGSTRAKTLLFVPRDASQPSWILYKAIPQIAEEYEARFSIAFERRLVTTWQAVEDSSGRIGQMGMLGDLTL